MTIILLIIEGDVYIYIYIYDICIMVLFVTSEHAASVSCCFYYDFNICLQFWF